MCEIVSIEWRDIAGYEGKYQVSSRGEVRSLRGTSPLILKFYFHYKGYNCIKIGSRTTQRTNYFVHRLVAQAFIENPHNKPFVNHIDCNKKHNCICNLEWMTEQENTAYYFAHRDDVDVPF